MSYDDRWTEEPELVEIEALILDDELFPRERLDPETVDEYAEAMEEDGAHFPPVRVIRDVKRLLLVDGWHRVKAARRLGYTKLHARVRPGDWFDAVEAAAASNARHGLKRTNADKRRSVEMLLAMPKWAEASDREIARHCSVSHTFVADLRASSTDHPAPIRGTWSPSQVLESGNVATPYPEPLRLQPPDMRQDAASEMTRQDEPWGGPPYPGPWPTIKMPVPISYLDILAWLLNATDSDRRRLADDAFDAIDSADERFRHDAKVSAWLDKHEVETTAAGDRR